MMVGEDGKKAEGFCSFNVQQAELIA